MYHALGIEEVQFEVRDLLCFCGKKVRAGVSICVKKKNRKTKFEVTLKVDN